MVLSRGSLSRQTKGQRVRHAARVTCGCAAAPAAQSLTGRRTGSRKAAHCCGMRLLWVTGQQGTDPAHNRDVFSIKSSSPAPISTDKTKLSLLSTFWVSKEGTRKPISSSDNSSNRAAALLHTLALLPVQRYRSLM